VFSALAFAGLAPACSSSDRAEAPPTFRDDVSTVLNAKCVECHSGANPAGGWRASSYMDVVGCVSSDGHGATLPRTDGDAATAPIVSALSTKTHQGSLPLAKRASKDEIELFTQWIAAGALPWQSSVHAPGFVDPRSAEHHSKFLRGKQWKPMLDANDPDACGRCHAGTPSGPPDGVKTSADRAPACTTCHSQAGGVLGCTTCHGSGDKPYGVRDVCFHGPDAAQQLESDHHDAHVLGGSKFMSGKLECSACHVVPGGANVLSGTHANGTVDVVLAAGLTQNGKGYDADAKTCTSRCHSGPGAARGTPSFAKDGADKIKCGDCHGAPPTTHTYKAPDGTCTYCHKELEGTPATPALKAQPLALHMNGKIDLGDGKGLCNSCHGNTGDSTNVVAMPTTGAHVAHAQSPKVAAAPFPCTTCHVVPTAGSKHPLGNGAGHVALTGLATARGFTSASYDPATKGCAQVYCHTGVPGGAVTTPTWTQGSAAAKCGDGCHKTPPDNHFANGTCGVGACHAGMVVPASTPNGYDLTPTGVAVHVNGVVNASP
jgi:predicted CxxxxCH...CXXCH cytochrome family protein